jgi:hypothetical protein
MMDQVLRISRRIFFLLTPVLSPAVPFCTLSPVLHDCSLYYLLGAGYSPFVGPNYSRSGHSLGSVSQGTHDGDDHPHITINEEAACNVPRWAKTLIILVLYKPILGSISFDLCNYVTEYSPFEYFSSLPC